MRRSIAVAVLSVTMLVGSVALCQAASEEQSAGIKLAAASSLDGTTWSVKLTPDEAAKQKNEKGFNDTLIFQGGKVTMTECIKRGFPSSAYAPGDAAQPSSFKAEQASQTEGKTRWVGAVANNAIKGTMIWTKNDGTVVNYTFEGTQAAAKPSAS